MELYLIETLKRLDIGRINLNKGVAFDLQLQHLKILKFLGDLPNSLARVREIYELSPSTTLANKGNCNLLPPYKRKVFPIFCICTILIFYEYMI